jgi:DNA (cytosine-5)-methyltransferase 1
MDYEESSSTTPLILKDSWGTPKPVYRYYDKRFNFVADVAASSTNALHKNFIDERSDSLKVPWDLFGKAPYYVWCNPPYSDITPWIRKATTERDLRKIGTVMLLPNQTATTWFKEGLSTCDEFVIVTKGRFSFINGFTLLPDGSPRLGSVFFIWHPISTNKLKMKTVDRDTLMRA